MRFSTLVTAAGVLGVLFGLGFLLAPAGLLAQYGRTTDPTGIIMAEFFGATLIQLGLIYLALRVVPAANVPKVALGACVGELAGLWVAVRVQLGGFVNAMGWSTVAIYAFFAIGFGLLAFKKA